MTLELSIITNLLSSIYPTQEMTKENARTDCCYQLLKTYVERQNNSRLPNN